MQQNLFIIRAALDRFELVASGREQRLDFPDDLSLSQRLEENSPDVHGGPLSGPLSGSLSVARSEQHLESRLHDFRLPRQLHAVYSRQANIREEQINRAFRQNTKRLVGIVRGQYPETFLSQHPHDEIAHGALVFDDQNGE